MSRRLIDSVAHTGITCSDIDRTIAFYRDVLGFPVSEKHRVGGAFFEQVTGVQGAEIDIAFVDGPGHRLELLSYASPEDRRPSTLRPCDPGFLHLCFWVDDIEAVVEAVRPYGYEAVNPVPDRPGNGIRGIYTRDPDGVVLELWELPPPSAR
jgi:catechol 2,3-dioxygenase-like lactoylglutathione lyase family enzyme